MKNILFLMLITFNLVSCSNSIDPNYNNDFEMLEKLDTKNAITFANEWHFNASKIITYVNTQQVVFEFPDGRIIKKDLPKDSMYIAIAPYINSTHTCSTHYISSCDGEMKNEFVKVIIKENNNNIIFNSLVKTMKNGFFELWLPRNNDFSLHIDYNSMVGEETLLTNENSKTCVTTIQLK